MRISRTVRRVAALAAVALLAAVAALAANDRRGSGGRSTLPQPVAAPGGDWYHATAARRGGPAVRRTACGFVLRKTATGVGDPVLPCGAKIFVMYGSTRVLTQVLDRTPGTKAYRFELTPALARQLGLSGVQPVRWAFARPGDASGR